MKKSRSNLPPISDEEEVRIQAGIALDPDNPELSDEELAAMRPASEVLPPDLYDALVKRSRGRPRSEVRKVEVKLRLDPDVVEAYRSGGPGWQTRMNQALRRGLKPKDYNG